MIDITKLLEMIQNPDFLFLCSVEYKVFPSLDTYCKTIKFEIYSAGELNIEIVFDVNEGSIEVSDPNKEDCFIKCRLEEWQCTALENAANNILAPYIGSCEPYIIDEEEQSIFDSILNGVEKE